MDDGLRRTSLAMLAAAAAGAVAALVIRDQMSRHSRNLFSPRFLRRLAALGHMARAEASVDNVNLLKDFVAWEPRRSLRNRATAIIGRMERDAARSS
ncbi:MAG: hypothetical protein ACC667_01070 [Longimicrobiales bacterium]